MSFSELPSKAAQLRYMQDKLANDHRWILRGLLAIYANQTADEQRQGSNTHHNGIGFTVHDAEYMTSLAHQCLNKGAEAALRDTTRVINLRDFFSEKQMQCLIRKMAKYANQLCKLARSK